MTEPLVITEKYEGICRVTMNRPEALNALSSALRQTLAETFQDLRKDPDVEVAILTGAGRAFTVGLDLKELGGEKAADVEASVQAADVAEAMRQFDRPIIGAVNGFAITGGFEIALLCDFLIASTEARFADTHARVGVVPGWGLSQRLPRLIGINRAKELSLTGNYLDAETARDWGLVNRVVAPDELLPVTDGLARDITSTEPATRSEILRIMDAGWSTTLEEGLAIERNANAEHGRREVRPDRIAARRAAIQNRGRNQSR